MNYSRVVAMLLQHRCKRWSKLGHHACWWDRPVSLTDPEGLLILKAGPLQRPELPTPGAIAALKQVAWQAAPAAGCCTASLPPCGPGFHSLLTPCGRHTLTAANRWPVLWLLHPPVRCRPLGACLSVVAPRCSNQWLPRCV